MSDSTLGISCIIILLLMRVSKYLKVIFAREFVRAEYFA